MRVDVRPRHRNSPRPAEKRALGFLQWVRGRACLVCNDSCTTRIEAAHVDYAGGKGVGTKVADRFAVPLCSHHHRVQHDMGWKRFETQFFGEQGMALKSADVFWRQWPGRVKWEAKQ